MSVCITVPMKKKLYAVVFACLMLSACATDESAVSSSKLEPKIGLILPIESSQCARDILDASRMAADDFNAQNPGLKFDIVPFDISKASVLEAVGRLTDEGVRVFCAGFDAQIISQHNMLSGMRGVFFNFMMAYPPATLQGKNSTRIFFNGAQEADLLSGELEKIHARGGLGNVAILAEDTPQYKSLSDYISFAVSTSQRKVFRDYFSPGESRFDIFARYIIPFGADAIIYVGAGPEFEALRRDMLSASYKNTIARMRGMEVYPKPVKGVVCPFSAFESGILTAEGREFARAFKVRYLRPASAFAAYGYDSAMLLMKAIKASGFDVSKIRRQFTEKSYDGACGSIRFDSSADSTTPLVIR